MRLQELKKKEKLRVDEAKGKVVTIFLQSFFLKLNGNWSWDMESDSVFCSDVMLALPAGFLGTKGIFHPDDIASVKQTLQTAKSNIAHLEFRMITTYGEVKQLAGHHITIEKAEDDISQTLSSSGIREIEEKTEFRHLQLLNEIHLRSERFVNGGTWYYNRTTAQTWYSDYIFRLHGIPPQSLNAHLHTFYDFIHPDDRELVVEFTGKAFHESLPLYVEYRIAAGGEEKHVAYKSQWFYSEKGETILYGTLQDITEQKRAEQETDAYKELSRFQKQQLLFDEQHVSIGHWQVDLLTRKTIYSDNYFRIFGLKPGHLSPNINSFINFIHPDDRETVALANKKLIFEHAVPDIEYRIIRTDGKTRHVVQKAKLVMHNQGLIVSGILHDVTVQRMLEKKVADLNEQVSLVKLQLAQTDEMGCTGSWVMDTSTGTITWSESFFKLLGYKTKVTEMTQRTLLSMIHPHDLKRFKDNWNKVLQDKQETIFNFRLLLRGAERHIKAMLRIQQGKDKEFFVGTLQDITLENVLQQQLANRVQLAESLTENILDRIMITDVNNTIILWNKACETAYGVKKEAALGQNFFDIFPYLKTEEETQLLYKALKGERIFKEGIPATSGKRFYDLNMIPLWANDEVSGILHIVHDVTKETELRNRLHDRLQLVENIVQSSVDRIIALDRNMNYIYLNRQAEEYYGFTKEQVLGKNILDVFPRLVNDPSYGELRKALSGEQVHIPVNTELQKYFETYLVPIKGEKGEVVSLLWMAHDLTGVYALQQERLNAQAELQEDTAG